MNRNLKFLDKRLGAGIHQIGLMAFNNFFFLTHLLRNKPLNG